MIELRWFHSCDPKVSPVLQYRDNEGSLWTDVPNWIPSLCPETMAKDAGSPGLPMREEIRILQNLNGKIEEKVKELQVEIQLKELKITQLTADNLSLQNQLKEAETISLGRAREMTRLRDSLRKLQRDTGEILRGRYAPEEG